MTAKTRQFIAITMRNNAYSEDKPWMLDFYHELFGKRLFFFKSKEQLIQFADDIGVKVYNVFHLERKITYN